MPSERRRRLLAHLSARTGSEPEPRRLCQLGVDAAGVSGGGIMVMSDEVSRGSLGTTDAVSALIEELQYTLSEGPSIDAYRLDRPVVEPDLANPRTARWLGFSGPALDAGVRAVFGFPLNVGAVRLGTLDLYRDQPGPLSDDQHADALVAADITATAILALQANAPPGALAADLEAGSDLHLVIHQASGMVAAQADVSVAEALLRLKANAFSHSRLLTDVARDVVAGRLRLDHLDGDVGPEQR